MAKAIVLTTAYLAPVQYYSKFLKYDKVLIEVHDHFTKQTYRNRCKIYAANGVLQLSVPVKKDQTKTKICDIKIDYDTNWRKVHWKSIESAYKASPFFDYYADDLKLFFNKKYNFLIDFNTELQYQILSFLDLNISIEFTSSYIDKYNKDYEDFREKIHPKKEIEDKDFLKHEYIQVFIDRYGFQPNLSIIDLLFNEGPHTRNILKIS
ncbi:MAG TPA: WbqC family protein [Bacteroidales bacterium]|nr:WbqC family protein [Bacteroidales bacterium]